jgi:diadenosine tetraphosphatase ApaH/serine/threonine PP2A family protein phosphatase
MANKSFEWTKKHASPETKEYLRKLPFSISFAAAGEKVLLFHATPSKNNLHWFEDRPEKFFREMAEKTDADVMIYGHTHKPYWKDFGGNVFVNAGSVGKPKDGDPRACVTLITIRADKLNVEFLRVPYDVQKAADAVIASGLPGYFADRLKEAR